MVRNLKRQPAAALVQELSRQLINWRKHLPAAIAWDEDQPLEPVDDINMSNSGSSSYEEQERHPSIADYRLIMNAALRTRYKYAGYLIWRPYIYRVLEVPMEMTRDEIEHCRKAYKVRIPVDVKRNHEAQLLLTAPGLFNVATSINEFSKPTPPRTTPLRVYAYVCVEIHVHFIALLYQVYHSSVER